MKLSAFNDKLNYISIF